jgi:hypothetical protein
MAFDLKTNWLVETTMVVTPMSFIAIRLLELPLGKRGELCSTNFKKYELVRCRT